jgi:hypothetical protein
MGQTTRHPPEVYIKKWCVIFYFFYSLMGWTMRHPPQVCVCVCINWRVAYVSKRCIVLSTHNIVTEKIGSFVFLTQNPIFNPFLTQNI